NAEAHNNWGVVLDRQGKLAEAMEHFQQALRIKLDYAEARANLARALALQGKGRQKSRPAAERPHPEAADGVSHAGEGRADKKGGGTKMKTHTRAIVLIAVAALASYVLRPPANLKAAEKSEHLVAQAPAGGPTMTLGKKGLDVITEPNPPVPLPGTKMYDAMI